jgi:hypothetical protein
MDLTIYKALNGLAASSDGFEDAIKLFTELAPYMFAALLGALFLARGSLRTQAGRRGAVAAGLSALLALAAAHVISGRAPLHQRLARPVVPERPCDCGFRDCGRDLSAQP